MRSERESERAINTYADMVRRLCLVHLKNHADTEDIFQNVFLKFVLHDAPFESEEHEKAWFIRVTINECRDLLRRISRWHAVPLEALQDLPAELPPEHREVLLAVLSLPEKYRDALYLHYYEDYTAPEIARLLNKNVNSVYTLINRGKVLLREALGGEDLA